MNKKRALSVTFIMVLFVSIIVSTSFISLASANAYPRYPILTPVSNPVISCLSPNNRTYDTDRVPLIVNVSNANPSDLTLCRVDGNNTMQFYGSNALNLSLVGLSDGTHQVEILVYYIGWHGADLFPAGPADMEKDKSILFTVALSLASSSPSIEPSSIPSPSLLPTLEPTVEPTSTPTVHVIIDNINPIPYIILAIMAIVIVLLVYFKKLRK